MSYLTDKLREDDAAARGTSTIVDVPGQMLSDILRHAPVKRRTMLRGSFGASIAALLGGGVLTACGGGDDNDSVADDGSNGIQDGDYAVTFNKVSARTDSNVHVPQGYTAAVLYSAGDALVGRASYQGSDLTLEELETVGGGQHDGMHFYELPGKDPNKHGLLAINHESTDSFMLGLDNRSAADQATAKASNVGVAIVEVQLNDSTNLWEVVQGSRYNKRYTGNTEYQITGPAKGFVGGDRVIGTLNNCASGPTPWGTYLTCEETTSHYFHTSNDARGYGWVVEIDPQAELSALAIPAKRTAMGRFAHENTAFMLNANNRVAFYMGDDSTPGAVYKFVPHKTVDLGNRSANMGLLDDGVLYAAKFNADGTGEWLELTYGKNGLTAGATDPGRTDKLESTPTTVDFLNQADVVIQCRAAARVAGATLMDRPEWITVGPDNKVYCTFTNNGGREVANPANPRTANSHGHIIEWSEDGDDVTSTTFTWSIFLLAGSLKERESNKQGDINGDEFSSPDGLRVDPKGRLWVQTDASTSATTTNIFGNNAVYYVNQETKESSRFLVGPTGCEITGLAYTPDLKTFFVNIQHPGDNWPIHGEKGRSSTIVVRRTDGKPVGA